MPMGVAGFHRGMPLYRVCHEMFEMKIFGCLCRNMVGFHYGMHIPFGDVMGEVWSVLDENLQVSLRLEHGELSL